jgi:hypothetical protein
MYKPLARMAVGESVKADMTNGDFIRSLPNEKLSTWIAEHTGCSDWCHLYDKCEQKPENHCCINVWFDWLEAERK